jgi:hypothetical protein
LKGLVALLPGSEELAKTGSLVLKENPMKRRIELFGLILSVGIVLGSAASARAQDKKPVDKPAAPAAKPVDAKPADAKAPAKAGDKPAAGQPSAEEMAMMEKMMKLGAPGEAHAKLKPMAGKWNFVTKWRMTADAPWQESPGKAEFKWIMGDRFLVQDIKGNPDPSMGGMSFEGHGMTGYDNISKKYWNTWLDNMGTGVMISEGTADGSGKVFTYESEYNCPMTGGEKHVKTVTKLEGDDKMVFQMFDKDEKGKEFQSLDVAYTRAK